MKKIFLITLALIASTQFAVAQKYKTTEGNVSFFSSAPIEDIDAKSTSLVCILNTKTNDVVFGVAITSFQFEKEKMREHFNENYMESGKYKLATFKGKIQEDIDYSKDTTYEVTVKGTLDIHGVAKDRIIDGKITIKDGKVTVSSDFDVKVVDHNIEIPKLVFRKIAETIKVTVNSTMTKITPKKK